MSPLPQRQAVVLIADDDEASRLLLVSAAEQAGFVVIEAADGRAALHAARTGGFDLALLDVEMPYLNGFEVCRALRADPSSQHKPIMMITGHDDAESIERAFEAGATDFMSKPLNWSLMPHRLRYLLRNARSEERIRQMAYSDELTGLPNLQSFSEFCADLVAAEAGSTCPQSVIVVLLHADGIERVNRSLGREVADAATLGFARRLTSIGEKLIGPGTRSQSARIDGGKFAICMCHPGDNDAARELAVAISQAYAEPIQFGEHSFFLQPSIGIAHFPDHGHSATELLMHADTAMQYSRANVSKPAVVYSDDMGAKSRRALRLDSDLKRAVRDEQLVLYYQPKICLADDSLSGVEALLRWFHPELGPISPAQFIPLAEESGLIFELGDWIVRAAFRQMLQWHGAGFDTSVAVNFASTQFTHGDPAQVIAAAARAVGLAPGRLVAELTESTFIGDLDTVQSGIAAVRALGCKVAVDDFGTGYSSLAYLRGLPADQLKVDRAFIKHVDVDSVDGEIYSAVLALAHKLGLSVTAEGVETPGQLRWLRAHGCNEAQGFLLAKPMPGHELLQRYGPTALQEAQHAG